MTPESQPPTAVLDDNPPLEGEAPPAERSYDAIVIGSGIGGMTAAHLLARRKGWRVLLLEQHFKVGGMTHEFRRQGRFDFDVGLHYLGELEPGRQARLLFDYLSEGALQWQRMPEDFDRFVYPGLDFRVPSDPREYERRLVERFPAEAAAIHRYFSDIKQAAKGYVMAHLADALPGLLRPAFRWLIARPVRLAGLRTGEYLERHFRDPALRALLVSQWGDYGLPPSESLFGMHAAVVRHYLRGAWYPVGGAKAIAAAMLPAVERAGGRALAGRKVAEILVENGRACGVRVTRTYLPDHPEEVYRAPVIISNAGVVNTYLRLLPAPHVPSFAADLERAAAGYSAVTLYVGLKDSPASLGTQGENLWIFGSLDHERCVTPDGLGEMVFLSFPSLKNPQAKGHTAEVISLAHYDAFERWKDQPWKHRDEAYQRYKGEIASLLLEKVEAHLPGFSALVEFQEVSTPVTMEHFQQLPKGSFYGVPARPGRLYAPWTRARSHVPGLYLTGQDVLSLGIMGAMMGGIKCAGALEGPFGFFRLMGELQRRPRGGHRTAPAGA